MRQASVAFQFRAIVRRAPLPLSRLRERVAAEGGGERAFCLRTEPSPGSRFALASLSRKREREEEYAASAWCRSFANSIVKQPTLRRSGWQGTGAVVALTMPQESEG